MTSIRLVDLNAIQRTALYLVKETFRDITINPGDCTVRWRGGH